MYFYCEDCKRKYPLNTKRWQCECGGIFRLFRDGGDKKASAVSIGESVTDLIPFDDGRLDFWLKMENLQPTGSFKDRGAYMLINELQALGIRKIVVDTNGNTGAALSAYASAAGMSCTAVVPRGVAAVKLAQIEAYGGEVVKVNGNRAMAIETAQDMALAEPDVWYISYMANPLFYEGMRSMALEIYQQLGNTVPEYIFLPVGSGTLLTGLFYGFEAIGRLPHLVAVQSENCAPVNEAWHGLSAGRKKKTVAGDIAVEKPLRMKEILMALQFSSGDAMTVSEEEIMAARALLGRRGIYAGYAAAAALAGAQKFFKAGKPDNYRVVVPMTGTGFKG
jgi:threonine synthase